MQDGLVRTSLVSNLAQQKLAGACLCLHNSGTSIETSIWVHSNQALNILKFSPQEASNRLEKLLLSAIANWEAKNEGARPEESDLIIREVKVDSARMLKRLQTAPQGRAHRIRKRSNHVTIIVDSVKN